MDIIGIGIGPSNLSLAALLHPLSSFSSLFIDKKKTFLWHQGMQLPFAQMQVSYLKDLVTLVDPQNPFSFLSFLSAQKRLYQFINTNFKQVSRAEFNQYYLWVCQQLAAKLHFNCEAKEVIVSKDKFLVKTDTQAFTASHLALGTGLSPYIPAFAKDKPSPRILHSSAFLENRLCYHQQKVAVIGGGQSSAEVVLHFMSNQQPQKRIHSLTWITSRDNFLPLDNSPFVNEAFTPSYSQYFYSLSPAVRKKMLQKQKLWSDGISLATLEKIYRALYKSTFIHKQKNLLNLLPQNRALDILRNGAGWKIRIQNTYTAAENLIDADIIILCTGYRYLIPDYLDAIKNHLHQDSEGRLVINQDFSLKTDSSLPGQIFIHNGAKHSQGIADPNLSLSAWRSALIINSIAQQNIYNTENDQSLITWHKL